jgi:hypothetical protein
MLAHGNVIVHTSVTRKGQRMGFRRGHEDSEQRLVVLDTFCPTSLTIWETDEEIKTNPKTTAYPIFKTFDASNAYQQLKKLNVKVGDMITDRLIT